jgi:hypothetical protein
MSQLKIKTSKTKTQITFCGSKSCCPSVTIQKNNPNIIIGGKEEGFTTFTKEQFSIFINSVKEGIFDNI